MNTLANAGLHRLARQPPTLRWIVAAVLVLAMALPVRIWVPLGTFHSFAPVDVILLASPLLVLASQKHLAHLALGRKGIALLLLVPAFVCVLSFVWSIDQAATTRAAVIYVEAMVAYLLTVMVCSRLPTQSIANLFALFVIVVVAVSVASALRVPGFEPQVPDELRNGSATTYLTSYYARLSNPYIGLSNNLATVLAFFPFVLASYARVSGRARYRWLALVCVAAIGMTLSRGVVLALGLVYTLWVVVNARRAGRSAWRIILYVALVATALFAFVQINNVADAHLVDRFATANVSQRLAAQASAMGAVMARPLGFGGGVALSGVVGGLMQNSHNAYVQQLFYFGIVAGTIVNLALLWLPWLVRRWQLRSSSARVLRDGLGYSLLCMLMVFVSEASFGGSVLRVLFYFSVGLGVSLVVAAEREARLRA